MVDNNGTALNTDALIQAMSDKDLTALKAKYAGNPSIQTLVDGILTMRKAEKAKALADAAYQAALDGIANTLPAPPDGIHNNLFSWSQVAVPTGEPAVNVTITDTLAVTDKDGNIVTPAITHVESRTPSELVWKWVVTPNHACSSGKSSQTTTSGTATTTKRAITVKQIVGDVVKTIGNFSSGSAAAKHLKLEVGANSAMRVLTSNGYITSVYTGTDVIA